MDSSTFFRLDGQVAVVTGGGQGIGEAMLKRLAAFAVERGCGRFEWSVLDWNAPAIGFYRTLGAVGMDEWTVQRLEGDALHSLAAHDAL